MQARRNQDFGSILTRSAMSAHQLRLPVGMQQRRWARKCRFLCGRSAVSPLKLGTDEQICAMEDSPNATQCCLDAEIRGSGLDPIVNGCNMAYLFRFVDESFLYRSSDAFMPDFGISCSKQASDSAAARPISTGVSPGRSSANFGSLGSTLPTLIAGI